jgi:hypothetical protein
MTSLRVSGADLTRYHEQLARDRNARTLTLRHTRPTLAGFLGRSSAASASPRGPKLDATNYPFLEVSYATRELQSENPTKIADFLSNISALSRASPLLVAPLLKSSAVQDAILAHLAPSLSEDLTITVIKHFVVLYPLFPDIQEPFVDAGLCFSILDLFTTDSPTLLDAVIALVDCISDSSGYARDSVLCLGIHSSLIETASREISEPLTVSAVEALNKVFANPLQIDSTTLTSCVEPMSSLLNLNSVNAVNGALNCFVSMTNKMPALVFTMFDLGLFPVIVGMLSKSELIGLALPLIGNLSVGHAAHIHCLLECHLFDILIGLIGSEHTADVFWVLSNLVESMPHLTIGYFKSEFIAQTVAMAVDSSHEIKKECGFFLATLVLFTEAVDLKYFMNSTVLDLMVELLGCSIGLIILRCLDALLTFARVMDAVGASDDVMGMLRGSYLHEALHGLLEHKSLLIRERAQFLLNQLEGQESLLVAGS